MKASICDQTWNFSEEFRRLVHSLVSFVHILFDRFRIDARQWIVHPRFVPTQPIGCRQPQVLEWFELFRKTTQLVVL